jgi:hypothetical protein
MYVILVFVASFPFFLFLQVIHSHWIAYEVITIPTGTFAVYHYTRSTNDSQVTDLYVSAADNTTLRKAVFVDGTIWLFKNYISGAQPAGTYALGSGSNTTQCNCKKKIDLMYVVQRDAQISVDDYFNVRQLIGFNIPGYTSNCGAPNYTFGFINAQGQCISGVNLYVRFSLCIFSSIFCPFLTVSGLTIYDTKPEVLMGFTGGVRGTNPTQVRNVVDGTQTTQFNGVYPCVSTSSGAACGQAPAGAGDVAAAIILAADNLAASDRTSAVKVILLVNEGYGLGVPATIAAAVQYAIGKGVSNIFSISYASSIPVSLMDVMVNDPNNLVYRNVPTDLATVDLKWPIEIVARYCTTDALPCGGTCCTSCDTSCGACVTDTPLACPPNPANNCSVSYKNTADGCCFISTITTCPYKPGKSFLFVFRFSFFVSFRFVSFFFLRFLVFFFRFFLGFFLFFFFCLLAGCFFVD